MEPDGEKRPQIGPKIVRVIDAELAKKLKGIRPPEDPDEQDYMAHVAFWEGILGVHPYHWTRTTDQVSECHKSLIEVALRNSARYLEEHEDYYKRIEELNESSNQFTYVDILPRSPSPRCFHLWHRDFRMTNTNPTSVDSMRFTQPGAYEYASSKLLQFFSMRFVGDFSHGQRMSIYGFVAVRDEVDRLRNYIFNRSRQHAQEITPDSPDLLLIPPTRGISAPYDVIVEYSLKVKGSGGDGTKGDDDEELIDGCFMFRDDSGFDITCRQARVFGPVGPLDIRFATMQFAVEATVEVKVKRAMTGYSLSMVTASTCGFVDEITLYDRSAPPFPVPMESKNGGGLSLSVVAAHAVVAVEVGCHVKLRFEISRESGCGVGRHARKSSHELLFTAKRYGSSKGAIVMGRMFKVAAKVTWSTMGKPFLPIFDCNKRSLLGDPDGPCPM